MTADASGSANREVAAAGGRAPTAAATPRSEEPEESIVNAAAGRGGVASRPVFGASAKGKRTLGPGGVLGAKLMTPGPGAFRSVAMTIENVRPAAGTMTVSTTAGVCGGVR